MTLKDDRPAMSRRSVLLGALALGGCSSSDKLLGNLLGEQDTVLPGKRESVLAPTGSALKVSQEPVAIPAAISNANWAQPGGTASSANHNLALGRNLRRIFSVSAGAGSDSSGRLSASPIVVGGRVCVLDAKARVRAFSAASGARAWAVSLVPKGADEDDGFGGGVCSDGRNVYVTTGFGEVVALSLANGAQIWRKKLALPLRLSPVVAAGRVYVRDNGNTAYCLSAADGSQLWSQQGESARTSLISSCSPSVGAGIVAMPFSSGDLSAFSAQGYSLWTQNLASQDVIKDMAARPVIDRGIVYACAAEGQLVALKAGSGAEIWSLDLGGRQTPCVAGDYLFHLTGTNRLSAIALRDGGIRWTVNLPGGSWTGAVMGGGRLLAASSKGVLAEISPQTGQVMKRHDVGDPVYIAPVIAAGVLYVLSDDGALMAYR